MVTIVNEAFDRENFTPLLSWMNPPRAWRVDALRSRLVIEPDARTDFWQRTRYGFQAGNGHVLGAALAGDAVLTAQFQCMPVHQYDQAGVIIWFSDDCWLKTSVEYEIDSPSQLGAVVTNGGFSDWSMQDFPPGEHAAAPRGPAPDSPPAAHHYWLRIQSAGQDCAVEYRQSQDSPWKMIRLAHLSPAPGLPCFGGVYACSPNESGFHAEVLSLRIESQE